MLSEALGILLLLSFSTHSLMCWRRYLEAGGKPLQQHLEREQKYCHDNLHAVRALQGQLHKEILDQYPDQVVSSLIQLM